MGQRDVEHSRVEAVREVREFLLTRKLMIVGMAVLVMLLAPSAEAKPVGPYDAEGHAFPGKRVIEVQDNGATFGAPRQEP